MDDDEALMLAREVVIRYHAHGFRTRVEEDAVFVWGKGGWEGPLDVAAVGASQADEIARIEADARVAAVAALAREAERLRCRGWRRAKVGRWIGADLDTILIKGCLRSVLSKAGWDEERAELYAGVAKSLHDRGELFRETLD